MKPTRPKYIYRAMEYEDWIDKYKPLEDEWCRPKDMDPNCQDTISFDEFKKLVTERKVWTLVSTDDGNDTAVLSGYRRVNRLEHYICEIAYKPNEDIEVQ